MTIDLKAALRRIKPDRHLVQLSPRPRDELIATDDVGGTGRMPMLVDTNVYILDAAGTLPPPAQRLIDQGLLFHCSVCLAELSVGIANADPSRTGWNRLRDHYAGLTAAIPPTRLLTPDADVWTEAGLVAGTLARTQNYQRHQRKECLNDALILLTAAKAGLTVLTGNRDEFDLIQQLAPQSRFVYF